jgi:hypothetical protein
MSRGAARRTDRPARLPTWTLGIIAALVVGAVLVLGYLAGQGTAGGADRIAFRDLKVGECLDVRVEGVPPDRVANDDAVRGAVLLGDAQRVACSGPHSHEVAETTGFDVGDAYRGEETLILLARPACEAGFATYVGHDVEGSALGLNIVAPDQGHWQRNDRRAVCLIRRNDGTYATGRLRDSGS